MAYPSHKDLRIKYNQTIFEADLIFNALHSICFIELVKYTIKQFGMGFLGGAFFIYIDIFLSLKTTYYSNALFIICIERAHYK